MIVGKLKDIKRYKGLNKNIDTAIDWLETADLLGLPLGKTEIDGKNVYVNRMSYVCKDEVETFQKAENHDNYLDLQIVIKGCEGFGYADITNPTMTVATPYNTEKDVTKYACLDELVFKMTDGSYALVFPEDVHRPIMKINNETVEKAVIKIKL